MAIGFNRPYCSALIRVPDSAGGGKFEHQGLDFKLTGVQPARVLNAILT